MTCIDRSGVASGWDIGVISQFTPAAAIASSGPSSEPRD
jgi:hypothetical protein